MWISARMRRAGTCDPIESKPILGAKPRLCALPPMRRVWASRICSRPLDTDSGTVRPIRRTGHPLIPYAGHFHARQGAPGMLQAPHDQGTIDYADIVRRLSQAGYAGRLCVEYTWQEWRGCNRLDVVSESIILRDQLRSYIAAAASTATLTPAT